MASYKIRAATIHELVVSLRQSLERHVDAAPADKAEMVDVSIEAINKLLYCFLLSQEMFDGIDALLNEHIEIEPTPQAISDLYLRVLCVVRQLEEKSHEWVVKYR